MILIYIMLLILITGMGIYLFWRYRCRVFYKQIKDKGYVKVRIYLSTGEYLLGYITQSKLNLYNSLRLDGVFKLKSLDGKSIHEILAKHVINIEII